MSVDKPSQRIGLGQHVVWLMFLGSFIMGSTELVAVGLVPEYAARVGIGLEAAGGAVGFYALGMFIVGPVLALATSSLHTKPVILASCAAFLGGTFLSLGPWAMSLFLGRLLAGAAQGVFLATSFQMIGTIQRPDQIGATVTRVLAGISVAAAIGLPAGSAIGTRLGVEAVTWLAIATATIVLVGLAATAPSVSSVGASSLADEVRTVSKGAVILRLGGLALVFVSVFTVVTQMSTLAADRDIVGSGLTVVLAGFGVGAVTGTFVGGRWAHRPRTVLRFASFTLPLVLLLLLISSEVETTTISALLLAAVAFAAVPPIQTFAATQSRGRLLPALPASAINAGIALGAALAGKALGGGPSQIVFTAIAPAVLAMVLLWVATTSSTPKGTGA